MQTRRRIAWMAAAILTFSALTGCASGATNNATGQAVSNRTNNTVAGMPADKTYTGKTVATFTGGDVKKDELDQLYDLLVKIPGYESQESKSDFLTYYIVWYKYVYTEAAKDKSFKPDLQKAKDTADQSIQQLVDNKTFKSKADALQAIKKIGASEDDLVNLALKGQYISNYVQKQVKGITVSDSEIQDFYNQNKGQFMTVSFHHVLVTSLSTAKQVQAELQDGADFAKTADKYSKDTAVKQNHGAYTDTPVSSLDPDFAKAVETLPIGKISDPVRSQYGYHVIRVDKRSVQPLSGLKDQIKAQLLQQKQSDKEQSIYNAAQKAASIKVLVKTADL